jgi:membrane-associated phospholipid phosphatase
MKYSLDFLLIVLLFLSGPLFIRKPYLTIGFIVGMFFTEFFNVFLKWVFKQPRPNTDLEFFKTSLKIKKNDPFFISRYCGMPSGHAQLAGFALVYIFLSTHSWWIWSLMAGLTAATCIQRVATQAHSVLQVLIGLFIGMVSGLFAYKVMVLFLKLRNPQGVFPKSSPFGSILYNW